MSYYLNLLINSFGHITWLTFILILIAFIAILFISIMSIILMLDTAYRPNSEQYSFNFILDRAIPFIALFSPTIIIIVLHPFETWFSRLILIIIIHVFILIPIFHYWSLVRHWENRSQDSIYYSSWTHPRLYKNIAIGMIYPLVWGIYFSCARFLRLGSTYDIDEFLNSLTPDIILIIFILPYVILWFLLIFKNVITLKNFIWEEFLTLLYSLHIYLLKYNFYFKIMEATFKVGFLITRILTLDIAYKNQGPWWRHITNYLYYNPKWITLMVINSLIFEVIFTKKLHFGLYILFIYTIIYRIFSTYFSYVNTDFVFDCCLSDYCHLKDNNIKIRYPQQFWKYFQDAEYYFGFEYEYTKQQVNFLTEEMNKPNAKWKLRSKISQSLHQDYVNLRIRRNPHSPFCLRVAADYLYMNRVRWVHTERIMNTAIKYHSCTALFARSVIDQIVLLNSGWTNLNHIQATKYRFPIFNNMYKSFGQSYRFHKKDFIGVQEENIPSNFAPLINKGVIVEPYDSTNKNHIPVYFPQGNPDTIFIFKNSEFIEKKTHVMDQKTSSPGIGRNRMLSEITDNRFETTLQRFQTNLGSKQGITEEIILALMQLKQTYKDFQKHQIAWAESLHLFPDNLKPPLKLPKIFNYEHLTPEVRLLIKISEYRMKRISDLLYAKKVPHINHGKFPQEALDIFNGSEIQRIFNETPPIEELD